MRDEISETEEPKGGEIGDAALMPEPASVNLPDAANLPSADAADALTVEERDTVVTIKHPDVEITSDVTYGAFLATWRAQGWELTDTKVEVVPEVDSEGTPVEASSIESTSVEEQTSHVDPDADLT